MLSQAYKEGMQHARKNGSLYNNPYPRNTLEYNDFERGWSQELKRNPQAIARADNLREKVEAEKRKKNREDLLRTKKLYQKAKDGY